MVIYPERVVVYIFPRESVVPPTESRPTRVSHHRCAGGHVAAAVHRGAPEVQRQAPRPRLRGAWAPPHPSPHG